jgi:hypothetical protein
MLLDERPIDFDAPDEADCVVPLTPAAKHLCDVMRRYAPKPGG